jgi:hypothetical protein
MSSGVSLKNRTRSARVLSVATRRVFTETLLAITLQWPLLIIQPK